MTQITPLVLVHVFGAVFGLLSGFLSMFLRKGSSLHRIAGTIFVISMLTMSSSAVYLSIFVKPIMVNVVVGILTFYLVSTAWVFGRRREAKVNAFDVIALLVVAGDGIAALNFGIQAAKDAPIYFIFGSIALLFAVSDVRMLVRRGVTGTKRLVRHLWRMCLALLIATLSFYPGQAKLFPAAWRNSGLMFTPLLLLVAMTIYWLVRVQRKRKMTGEARVLHAQPVSSAAG